MDKNEIQIMYCPTELMLGDLFTKPLQGNLFRRFREIVMGRVSIEEIIEFTNPIKERVGNISEELVIENVNENMEKENQDLQF